MSKGLGVHAAERVDLEDFLHGVHTFPKGEISLANAKQLLDNQSRVLSGFRVEIPDQTVYPGRIVVHGGYGLDVNGQRLYNEDYSLVSRTVTLEGSSTTFWVEAEFVEVEADSDVRAFWDPTVEQDPQPSGDPNPAGQEFGNIVSTRKALDWRVVTPIRVGAGLGFTRDADPTSPKIPVAVLTTDGSGLVTASSEKSATVVLEIMSTTPGKLRVVDAQHFQVGDIIISPNKLIAGRGDLLEAAAGVVTLTDALFTFTSAHVGQSIVISGATDPNHNGTFTISSVTSGKAKWSNGLTLPASLAFNGTWSINIQQTKTILSADVGTGIIILTGNISALHSAGSVIRNTGTSTPNFLVQNKLNRYERTGTNVDCRDGFFQGDEVHGNILSQGLDNAASRSDLNLRSLKDHIDFLSAQIQEMKWGAANPSEPGGSAVRTPPGVTSSLASPQRYFDFVGSIQGARVHTLTIGDGVTSWGDFIGNTQATLNAAIEALPAAGGTIYIKDGSYFLSSDFDITKPVAIFCSINSKIYCEGGQIHVSVGTADSVYFRGLRLLAGLTTPSYVGVRVDTNSPFSFEMYDCALLDVSFDTYVALPGLTTVRQCVFTAASSGMASIPLVRTRTTSGQITGTWTECYFLHASAVGINGACVDASSGTNGLVSVRFVNCSFLTVQLCWESIHMGPNPNVVMINSCTFGSFVTLNHITIPGGKNIKLTDCVGSDAVAAFLNATGVTDITVEGYLNPNSTLFPSLSFTNCKTVKVRNCSMSINSILSLSFGSVQVVCTTGASEDILIEGNTIECTSDLGTGVVFDLAGGQGIRSVTMVNNTFNKCECGIFFNNSGVAALYSDINIGGNTFIDRNSLFGIVSDYQKVGIYAKNISTKSRWSIIGNNFTNFNPINTNTVGGVVTRNAVYIAGGNNYEFVFKANRVLNVGDGFFPMASTGAFRMGAAINSVFDSNTIVACYGTYAHGIFCDAQFDDCTISNNVIKDVQGSTASLLAAGGISALKFFRTSITGNTFRDVRNIGGGIAGNIIVADTAAGEFDTCTVTGNTFFGTDATYSRLTFGVCLYTNRLSYCTISNNTISGYSCGNIFVTSTTGGYIEQTTISGNTSKDCNGLLGTGGCIWVAGNGAGMRTNTINGNTSLAPLPGVLVSGSYFGLTINDNSAENTSNNPAIYVDASQNFTINGNSCARASGSSSTIIVNSSSNLFVISGNRCRDGSATGNSINTWGSGATKAIVIGNVFTAPVTFSGGTTDAHNVQE